MEKNELLKTVGFSEDFIKKIEEFEKDSTFEVSQNTFSNENVDYSVNDTSELFIQSQSNRDSHELIIK